MCWMALNQAFLFALRNSGTLGKLSPPVKHVPALILCGLRLASVHLFLIESYIFQIYPVLLPGSKSASLFWNLKDHFPQSVPSVILSTAKGVHCLPSTIADVKTSLVEHRPLFPTSCIVHSLPSELLSSKETPEESQCLGLHWQNFLPAERNWAE